MLTQLSGRDGRATSHSDRIMDGGVLHRSFLRWVGGKQLLLKRLIDFLPPDIRARTYREPFLGAGSLFFALRPDRAVLGDLNPHLVDCYHFVREAPETVGAELGRHASKDSQNYYYFVRDRYNSLRRSAAQAARFIYLNRTCFNGICRVNREGKFNVPYGKKARPVFPSVEQLRLASQILRNAEVCHESFEKSLKNASESDFVYLDPPYPPLNGTSYFTHYTLSRFGDTDQTALAACANQARTSGAAIMMTNADTPVIRRLYKDYWINSLEVTRFVTCKKKRHKVKELVITSYEPTHDI